MKRHIPAVAALLLTLTACGGTLAPEPGPAESEAGLAKNTSCANRVSKEQCLQSQACSWMSNTQPCMQGEVCLSGTCLDVNPPTGGETEVGEISPEQVEDPPQP